MSLLQDRRVATGGELAAIALLGPLLVPGVLLVIRLVSGLLADAPTPAGSNQLLLLLGPAIPVYVAALPLLPMGIVKLRQGWRPRVVSLLLGCIGLALLIDVVFRLAAG
jgi:hypothetical protein